MEQDNKKPSVKSRFSVFMAGILLAFAGMLVSSSSWFLQFSQPVLPYVKQASDYAQQASNVSQKVYSVASDGVNGIVKKYSGATSGLSNIVATSSTLTFSSDLPGSLNTSVFPYSGQCTSRVIGTTGNAIMLSFGTNGATSTVSTDATTTVSAFRGFVQAASTTVAYDAGLYGCGFVGAYSFGGTTTITRIEFR